MAIVLGDSAERALRQSLIMSDASVSIFFTRPIAATLTIVAIGLLLLPLFRRLLARVRKGSRRGDPGPSRQDDAAPQEVA